jgi:protein-L-isoaspartate(D-aspartate) O-methyltransferase
MAAMRKVPRDHFVSVDMKRLAYSNGPLPIGCGQTISQPYIVALMTDLLQPQEDFVVLEVGTGSGYQSAVLSRLVKKVYSTEIIEQLAHGAEQRLQRLQYDNVEIKVCDGYFGWNEYAPFDGIIVTAAASEVPPPLIEQLKPGSRLVIPVGKPHMYQELMVIEKDESGQILSRNVLGVAFVPLTGDHNHNGNL